MGPDRGRQLDRRGRTGTREQALLYVEPAFDEIYDILSEFDRPEWKRRTLRRSGGDRWLVWQLSYFSDVDGIEGGVGLNVRRPSS